MLTGRNIVCGPGLYLFFHGVNYQTRERTAREMYRGGEDFLLPAKELGVDYVFISDTERSSCDVNEEWFASHFPKIYDSNGVCIYRVAE